MKLFHTELIKLKNTFALWMTILGALFMPLLLFFAYLIDEKQFVPAPEVNPWYEYLLRSFNGSCLFSTGFILLIIGLIINVEHMANGWKHLFTLPISRGKIYFVKLAFIFATIITFVVLYFFFSVVLGELLGLGKPELKFGEFNTPYAYILRFLIDFFVSIIPVIVIQYWVSLRMKNLVASLGLGLLGLLLGLLFKNTPNIVYFPYAMPFQMWNYEMANGLVLRKFFWVDAAYTFLFLILSYRDFTRRFRGW